MNSLNNTSNEEKTSFNPFRQLIQPSSPTVNPLRLTSDASEEDKIKEHEAFLKYANDISLSAQGVSATYFNQNDTKELNNKREKEIETFAKLSSDMSTEKNAAENASEIVDKLRSDAEDKVLRTVSLTQDAPQLNTLKSLRYSSDYLDEVTFRGSSTAGFLLDPNASAAQYKELLTVSPSSMKYGAIRLRGGLHGEFWKDVVAKSEWLRNMFVESPEMKDYIDKWANIIPYLNSTTANTAVIGTRYTPLDMLANAKAPQGWDSKIAIQNLKDASPELAAYLFDTMGIKEDDLAKQSLTPDHFKFLVADAVDSYAMGEIIQDFTTHNNNAWVNTTLWPMLRDSANSSDSFAEYVFFGAGAVLTATGVTAEIGVPMMIAAGAKIGFDAAEVGSKTYAIARRIKAISIAAKRISDERKITAGLVKLRYGIAKTSEFLPHQLSETIGKKLASKIPIIGKVHAYAGEVGIKSVIKKAVGGGIFREAEDITKGQAFAALPTWAARTFLAEAAEGTIEDIFRQHNAISTGFQTNFSFSDLINNAKEEGVGGLMLAPIFHGIGHGSRFMMRDAADGLVLKTVNKTFSYVTRNMSPEAKLKLQYFAKLSAGLPEDTELTAQQYVDLAHLEYTIHSQDLKLQQASGLGSILDPNNSNPVVKTALDILSNGQAQHRDKASLELLGMLGAVVERLGNDATKLTNSDFISLVFLIAQRRSAEVAAQSGDQSDFRKLLGSVWVWVDMQRTKDNKTKSIELKDLTDENMEFIANHLANHETRFLGLLGIKDFNELQSNLTLAEEHKKVIQGLVQTEANETKTNISVESESGPLPGINSVTTPNNDEQGDFDFWANLGSDREPVTPEATPAAPEAAALAPEATPAAPEAAALAPEATPAAPKAAALAPEATPEAAALAPEATPAAPEATPAAPEATPAAPEATPAAPEAAPQVTQTTQTTATETSTSVNAKNTVTSVLESLLTGKTEVSEDVNLTDDDIDDIPETCKR